MYYWTEPWAFTLSCIFVGNSANSEMSGFNVFLFSPPTPPDSSSRNVLTSVHKVRNMLYFLPACLSHSTQMHSTSLCCHCSEI